MKPGTASKTALRVALRRAAHQLLDVPLVFPDPLALAILGQDLRETLTAAPRPLDAKPWDRVLRAFLVARSRYAEDQLARAVAAGVRQYVVLGAALDTFAYRNPYPGLRVFEVDEPATQAWKRERLASAGIALPSSLVLAGVNFEAGTLAGQLRGAGLDDGAPAFFSWLGVVPYLRMPAVIETLQWIAALPRSSAVVFDYATPPSRLTAAERAGFDALAARVAAAGEPWQTFFDPYRLEADPMAAGFSHVIDVGPDEINGQYFQGRSDGLRVSGTVGHLVHAQV